MEPVTGIKDTEAVLLYITDGYPFEPKDNFSGDDLCFLTQEPWQLRVLPRYAPDAVATQDNRAFPFIVNSLLCTSTLNKARYLLNWHSFNLFFREVFINVKRGFRPRFLSLIKGIAIALHARAMLRDYLHSLDATDKPIVIYTFWFSPVLIGCWILRQEFSQMRIVTRMHGFDLYASCSRNSYLPFRFWRKDAADILAPCSKQGVAYLEEEGVNNEKLVCSHLGVPAVSGLACSSPLGAMHIVSCSFATPVKRLPLLGRSIINMARSNAELKVVWHHLGAGPELKSVQELLSDLPVNMKCTLHGKMQVNETRQFFLGEQSDGLDCLINVSESEGLPVSMMEAQMVGLPIVGTDVGGVSEIVNAGTGKLLPKDFTQAQFDSAILSLYCWKDAETRKRIAAHARELFSFKNYKQFIDEVLWAQMQMSQRILVLREAHHARKKEML